MLTGNDIMVLVRLAAKPQRWTFRSLGDALAVDPATLHRSVARLKAAKLLDEDRAVNRANLEEFLVHAIRFLIPVEPGPLGRGVPTAWAAEPLRRMLAPTDDPVPVWPHPKGETRGTLVEPIADSVPSLWREDPGLTEWFALIDAIRIGRARERKLAAAELSKRIWRQAPSP